MSHRLLRTATSNQAPVWWALAILLGLRFLSLGLYPLMDNTEARYGEIARVMLSQNDWITPWYDHNVPFWGKPPLSFWATAASLKLFGINEFAARLPHFLAALGLGGLVWGWAVQRSRQEALTALALLASCSLMLVSAGAVMTDMFLAVGTLLSMRGFWLGLHGRDETQRRRERWLLFLGLAVGLLAKGPVVLVLVGLPLGLWTLFSRQLGRVWGALPWLRGSLAVSLLVGPWYAAAELRTPGFLDYFLLGEHWHRFVTPGWTGDRYGVAHSAPWGSIWVYAVVAILPWSLLLPLAWWRWRKEAMPHADAPGADTTRPKPPHDPSLQHYWLVWSLAPIVFFTCAGNILWTYMLPALPPLALLGASWLTRQVDARHVNRVLTVGLSVSALLFAGFVGSLRLLQAEDWHTTQHLIAHYVALNSDQNALIFYPARPYSAAFYSCGRAEQITDPLALRSRLSAAPAFLAVKTGEVATLPPEVRPHLHPLARHGDYTLFVSHPDAPLTHPITSIFITDKQLFGKLIIDHGVNKIKA